MFSQNVFQGEASVPTTPALLCMGLFSIFWFWEREPRGSKRHCERSEAIHRAASKVWIASSQALLAMTLRGRAVGQQQQGAVGVVTIAIGVAAIEDTVFA
jgi:hypothetical protein